MTKLELLDLLENAIKGRKEFSIVVRREGVIRIYDTTDSFTAIFIADAIKMTGDAFTGITVDCDGRPYMLFTY